MDADLESTIGEVRVDVLREHLRIRPRDIDIDLVHLPKVVESVVERQVGVFAVFGRDSRKIHVWGKDFSRQLHLVDKDIVPAPVLDESRLDLFAKPHGVPAVREFHLVEGNLDDVVFRYALGDKPFLENNRQQIGLASPPYAREDLDKAIVPPCHQGIDILVSIRPHTANFSLFVVLFAVIIIDRPAKVKKFCKLFRIQVLVCSIKDVFQATR